MQHPAEVAGPGTTAFPGHPAFLRACSDALVDVGLWAGSAGFGELAVPAGDPDVTGRIEIAWRLWRAARPDAALTWLAGLPDDTHPVLPVLRAAAVATRDPTPDGLAAVLREASARPPTGLVLRIVVLAALAVGDRGVALDAAARYLATVDADDPDLRRIMAPEQATAGDLATAVASTEWAATGRPGDADGPVREVVAELREAGRDGVAQRFLAEGFHRTGRSVYGELLVEQLPRRVLTRDATIVGGVVGMFAGLALLVSLSRSTGLAGFLAGALVGLGAVVVMVRGVLLRAPGSNRVQTNRISLAVSRHRSRSGSADLALPVVGVFLAVFAVGLFLSSGRTARTVELPGVLLVLAIAAVGAGLAALATMQFRRHRRSRLAAAEDARLVTPERCRCWERDWFAGPSWHRYRAEHLALTATDPRSGAVLHRCPTTDKAWLHMPAADVTVRVLLPAEAEPEQISAAYL